MKHKIEDGEVGEFVNNPGKKIKYLKVYDKKAYDKKVYDNENSRDLYNDLFEKMNRSIDNPDIIPSNLREPQLIISINGAAKKILPLNMNQKLIFKRGLLNVATAAPTWIITGGFEQGITKLVGDASKEYSILYPNEDKKFLVLGIGAFKAVDKTHFSGGTNKTRNNNPGMETLNKGEKGVSPLDPNHDAFILFDDTSEKGFGQEIEFRTEFEKLLSLKYNCCVQIIVEGGKNTIATGGSAILKGIPVLVMKGSRRAADIICEVIESYHKEGDMTLYDTKKEDYLKIIDIRKENNEIENEAEKECRKNLNLFCEYFKKRKVRF